MTMPSALKSIPVSAYPESAWRLVLGVEGTAGDLSTHAAYAQVPIVYRCVRLRSKAVQRIPIALMKGKTDVTERADNTLLLTQIAKLLYQFEASLCVYAAAYALKQQGRLSGVPSLRWVTSAAITPEYDEQQGVKAFKRQLKGSTQTLKPEELVYCWVPILDQDIGPGVAPVQVALRAAGVLNNLDAFLEGFFDRGALRVTLLTVEGNPPEREIQKLESWWKKTVSGVKNAFASVGVRANVKPVTIGDSLKDTVDATLTDAKTQQVLEAMEVPSSIALPDAANYATARQDWLNFYEATIIPEAEQIVLSINDQWLLPATGMRIELHPERLEAFQSAELEKAGALVSLVGPVLTQNEARQKLELPPITEDVQDDILTALRAKIELLKLANDAGLDVYQIAPMVGLEVEKPEPPPPPPQPALPVDSEPDIIDQEPPADQAEREMETMRALDLDKWKRKAIKRGRPCEFDSIWIPPDEAELIALRMKALPIAEAFKIDPPGTGLSPREKALYDALVKLLAGYEKDITRTIQNGEMPDLSTMAPDLRAAFIADLTKIAMDVAMDFAEGIGPDLDPAQAATAASDWARQYAGELISGITDKTQVIVQQAVATYIETPGMTRAQLSAMLSGAFGERRAETIAITEATRAAAEGTAIVQQHLAAHGLTFVRVWQTVKQEACLICEPLDGKKEGDGWTDGPPAHPRCRCAVTLERVNNA